jgi:hypothetical protein
VVRLGTVGSMASAAKVRRRQRGEIEALPNDSFRVRVYAGIDPLTKKRHYVTDVVPAGPKAAARAETVRTRLLSDVERAVQRQAIGRWFLRRGADPERGPLGFGPARTG